MAPADVDGIGGGVVLEEYHVAYESRSRVRAFEHVVAQNAVFRESCFDRLSERIDVIDALADERTLAEHVLVDVRDRTRVGIDPRFTRERARVGGPISAAHAGTDPWLKNAIAGRDPPAPRIVSRAVQRVRHRSD